MKSATSSIRKVKIIIKVKLHGIWDAESMSMDATNMKSPKMVNQLTHANSKVEAVPMLPSHGVRNTSTSTKKKLMTKERKTHSSQILVNNASSQVPSLHSRPGTTLLMLEEDNANFSKLKIHATLMKSLTPVTMSSVVTSL